MAFLNPTPYAAVQATTRALYADLLTPEQLALLARAPDTATLLAQLGQTPYAPYLDIARQLLTPRRIVYQLRLHLAAVYAKLLHFAPKPARELLGELWRLYEVNNLKAVLRGIEQGATWREVRFLLAPMPHHTVLPLNTLLRLLETDSIERAIERLRGLPAYYKPLLAALPRYRAEETVFPLEIALDLEYRRALWQRMAQLPQADREQALPLLGFLLDTDNLLWALRFRLYQRLSEEEIINYTLAEHDQVSPATIRAIAAGADVADVIKRTFSHIPAVQTLKISRQGALLPPGTWLPALEQVLYAQLLARCRQCFVGATFHIGAPLAYVILAEAELRDLTALVERVAG